MRIDEKTFEAMPPHIQALFRKLPNPGSDEVVALFPNSGNGSGEPTVATRPRNAGWCNSSPGSGVPAIDNFGDTGSAARFFYCAKASKEDRDGLLEGAERDANKWNAGGIGERRRQAGQGQRINHHPTVKPTELMRYLCRLVTPPRGVVLDPFAGSGSTGIAAIADGFRFIGIELEAEYLGIARTRIDNAQRQERMFA